eukprot:1635955-Alexandrium_andersonii.AAC.1
MRAPSKRSSPPPGRIPGALLRRSDFAAGLLLKGATEPSVSGARGLRGLSGASATGTLSCRSDSRRSALPEHS